MNNINGTKENLPQYHHDKDLFKSYIQYTTRTTGFRAELIEKDYYLILILAYFYKYYNDILYFKGGGCLNKIYFSFYRLSEDLDFSISISPVSSRNERSKKAKPFIKLFNQLARDHFELKIIKNIKGYNNSRQYNGVLSYDSIITGQASAVKIEVGLREKILQKPFKGKASTLLQNPYKDEPLIPDIDVLCLSMQEAIAEKVRAALTRKELAIRDYYDIYYAYIKKMIDFKNAGFIKLVKAKISLPDIEDINKLIDKQRILSSQLESELKSVLKDDDFQNFNLDRAVEIIDDIYSECIINS